MTITMTIDNSMFGKFPILTVYGLRVKNMRSALAGIDTAIIPRKAVANCMLEPDRVGDDPTITEWRGAYGAMGVKPSKYRSSIESLLRRAAKKGDIALPIPAVNIYNACSIEAKAPIGGYDIERLPGSTMELRYARPGTDRFQPLGAEVSAFPITSGLAVYAVGDDIMCWGWNARDCAIAGLTEASDLGVFFAEAVQATQLEPARQALELLSKKMTEFGAIPSPIQEANATMTKMFL